MYRRASLALLLLVSCSSQSAPHAQRVISSPIPKGRAEVSIELATKPPPTPEKAQTKPTTGPAVQAQSAPGPVGARSQLAPPLLPSNGTTAFRSLGAWIDVFDHSDDPNTILPLVRGVAKQGARTLYLETARYTSETDIQFPKAIGAALDEAKQLGLRVVAWYPPGFADLDRDVRRSLAAIKFRSPGGNRFDAFGADIEYTAALPDHAERTKRTIQYSERLRAGAGGYPLAAIVIPPTSLEVNPGRWPNFPWQAIAPFYEVFMPMNYWTAREKTPKAASDLTTRNVDETERLTGRPVHIIGGLGEYADEAQVAAYVKAAKQSGSLGGGLYDYRTTRAEVWDELRGLN